MNEAETRAERGRKPWAIFLTFAEAALALSIVAWPAYGWNRTGHHVVANIAYERLGEKTRARLVTLLRQHERFGQDFAVPPEIVGQAAADRYVFRTAAEWPDIIRKNKAFHHGSWHYINERLFLSELDRETLDKVVKPNLGRDLPAKLPDDDGPLDGLNAIQAIKLSLARLNNPKTADSVRAVHLCWLMHVVGDLHQPLHSTALFSRGRFNQSFGDKGGNDIPILGQFGLHSYWDNLLDPPMNQDKKPDLHLLVATLTAQILADKELRAAGETAVERLDPETCVQESHKLCVDVVYARFILDAVSKGEGLDQKLPAIELTEEYRMRALAVARRRIAEAGFRLAAILEGLAK